MSKTNRTSLCAAVAISAAAALGSTPLLAQVAAPSLELPSTVTIAPPAATAPAAPTPTIVLPPVTEAAPEPEPQPAPQAESRAAAPAKSRERTARTERPAGPAAVAQPAPASATAVQAPPPAAITPAAIAAAADVPQAPAPAAPAADITRDSVQRSGIDVPEGALAAALLGIVGIGAAGLFAIRRRRQDDMVEEAAYTPAPIPAPPIPAPLARVEPALAPPAAPPVRAASPALAGSVPTGDARQALLDRMVAAEPDEANPFTSGAARRKRARILLQKMESDQRHATTTPFDWRTYQTSTALDPSPRPKVDA